jgi:hypothetical protein
MVFDAVAYPVVNELEMSILWIFWYIREASTAMLVANIPNCSALLRYVLNLHGNRSSLSRASHLSASLGAELGRALRGRGMGTGDIESESTETTTGKDQRLEIWQQSEFAVEESTAKGGHWAERQRRSNLGGEKGQTKSTVIAGNSAQDHESMV